MSGIRAGLATLRRRGMWLLASGLLLAAPSALAQNAINTATITAPTGVTDPNTANNTATDSDTIVSSQLTLTKTHAGNFTVGVNGVFTLTVSNAGTSPTVGAITVQDTLPTGLTFVSGVGPGWTCSAAAQVVTCSSTTAIAAAVGATPTAGNPITLTVAVAAAAVPSAANTARAGGGGDATCPVPPAATPAPAVRCSATDTATVGASADLTLTKTNGVTSVAAGGTTTYTIVLTNNGPSAAGGTVVTDPASTGLTKTAVTCAAAGGAVCPAVTVASFEAGVTVATLPSTGSLTFTVTATVTATSGSVTNNVTATLPAGTTDPTPVGVVGDTDTVAATADLAVTKTNNATSVTAGGTTTYTVTVTNNGPSASTATLTDAAATGLTKTAVACSATPGVCTTAPTVAQLQAGFVTPSIPSGGTYQITVTATVTATSGSVTNSVTAQPPTGTTDPTPGNNTGADTDTVGGSADLTLTKTNGVTSVAAGGATSYTIVLTNNGPSAAGGTVVTDPASTGLTKTTVTCAAAGGAVCPAVTVASFEAGVTVATLPSTGSLTFTVTATVTATSGSVTNNVTATLPAGTTDPTPTGTVSDTDTVARTSDLSLTKTAASTANAGSLLVYTLTVTNGGPSAILATDTLTINEALPAGLTNCTYTQPAGSTIDTGSINPGTANGSGTITNLPLASGASAVVTISCTVAAANGTVLTNTASVVAPAGVTDPVAGNNGASTNTTVNAPELTLTKTASAANFTVGVAASYTLSVQNTGGGVTTAAATVTDTVPTGLTIGTLPAGCTAAGQTVTCTIATGLAANATTSFVIPVTPTAAVASTTLNNTASISGGGDAACPAAARCTSAVNTPVAATIVANNDFTPVQTFNAGAGGTTPSVVLNDTTNGQAAVIGTNVTLVPGTSPNAGLTMNANGTITVAATTPPGTYQYPYQICTLPATTPATCATATATVIVAATIVANNDFTPAQTFNAGAGGTTPSVVLNDTTNGQAAVIGTNVTLVPGTSPNAGLTMNANGTITVAATTPPGTYQYPYQICTLPATTPATCATATATVIVAATIVANNDNFNATPINGVTGGTTATVVANDMTNGVPAVVGTNVALTPGVAPTPTAGGISMNANGTITVAPGTTAGTYTYPYTICTLPATTPATCSTASAIVVVTAAAIVATADTPPAINGATGGTTPSALGNDTLNGAPVTVGPGGTVTLTPGTSPNAGLTMNPDGTITVAPGTPAGTYVYPYTICEVLNPANCATSNVTVVVGAAPIDAVDDTGTVANGAAGGQAVANVLVNDTLNGQPATLTTVTLTQVSTTNANVTLNPATGAVVVAPNTAAGTYTVVYQICEVLNPTNCDTASVTVTVAAAAIVATADTPPAINGATGGTTPSALGNDTLNGAPVTVGPGGTVTLTPGTSPNAGLTMNPDGTITVAPGTPAGTYVYPYTICEVLNPANCATSNVTVVVGAAPIDAVDDTGTVANGAAGGQAVANVLVNDTLNGQPATLTTVTLTQVSTTNANVTLNPATGAVVVAPNTAAGTYTVVYQICEVLNPTNCDTASVTVTVAAAAIVATADTPPAINGATGGTTPSALGNDTLNGAPVTVGPGGTVTLTPGTSPNAGLTMNPDGTITVAPGTLAGTYVYPYTICEVLNPANCATSNVTVVVGAAPIDAVDDTGTVANGAAGGQAVANVLVNDTLNGQPATLTTVTLTQVSTTNANVTLNPATGAVVVAPNTAAGTYTVVYQICEVLNPTNCDTASVTVTVAAAAIVATADTPPAINGATGGTTPSALGNDTLNGAPVTVGPGGNVTLTPGTSPNAGLTMNPDGTITVAPGTPAGTYVYPYTICEVLNPANCATSNVTVVVGAAPIDAVDDTGTVANGAAGGQAVANVLVNDTLNGQPATLTTVTLTQVSTTNANVTLNPATGAVGVAPNTAAGTYTVVYQICEVLNPTNCDTASVTVTVAAAAIVATADTPPAINGATGGTTPSALGNDTLNGAPVTVGPGGTVTLTPGTSPNAGLTMNPDGTITVAPGTPAGTYVYPYTICEVLNPTNCATSNVTVVVGAAPIDAVDDTGTVANGAAGGQAVANVLVNDTLNGQPATLTTVTLTQVSTTNANVTLNPATGAVVVAPNTAAGTYTVVYQICEVLNPTNCDTASVTVTVAAAAIVATADTPPAINGATGGTTPSALGNDTLNGAPVTVGPGGTVTLTPGTSPNAGLTTNPDGTITVAPGTPAGTYVYPYTICEVLNPANCATSNVTVVVDSSPIVAKPDSATTPQNTAVTISVLGNDTLNGAAVNPTQVTVTQASAPANGTIVVNNDGTISYTPNAGFSGTDTFTYQVCEILNPANCATATVTVTVQPNAVKPIDDTATTPANTPVTINILGNDTSTGAPINPASVTITVEPAHGTVTVNPDGTVIFTPAPGYLGTDAFTYQVCDTSVPTPVCATATVTVTISGSPPVTGTAGDSGTGPAGKPVTINVLANDSDPDNNLDPGSVVIVGAPGDGKTLVVPGQGTWTVNPDGTITFTPEAGFVGDATPIQYTVSDTTGLVSNPSTVRVTITGDTQLRVTKVASPRDVKVGDLVRYTVTLENVGTANVNGATLIDTPPAGFTYVSGSLAVADRDNAGALGGTYPLNVGQIDVNIGQRATVTYLLRVGAGVRPGTHTNSASANIAGTTISNTATADVELVADPLLDESLLVGTVFNDNDGDGWQDRATLEDIHVQGGFAADAYVPDSTTVDHGDGAKPELDASSPMLHGIAVGTIAGRQSEADTAASHAVVISQLLRTLDFDGDFTLTSKQGVTLHMDAAGATRIERSGDAAKGLNAAEPKVERRVSQVEEGYRVDYIVSNDGIDERGIPGVRIASVEGLLIESDQFGRFHLEGVPGGSAERGRNYILKVDPATLPPGSTFTTQNPLVRRITPGLPVRFDFGVKLPSGLVEGGTQDVEMELGAVMFDADSAKLRAQYKPVIEQMVRQVREHDGAEVVIAANGETQELAYERATAVRDAMITALPAEQAKSLKVSLRTDLDEPGTTLATVGETTELGTFLFDTDKATIKPEFQPLVERIAADLDKRGGGVVGVVGHADKRGSDAYNVQLGLRRAKAVYEAITAKMSPAARSKLRVEISDNPTAPVGIDGQ